MIKVKLTTYDYYPVKEVFLSQTHSSLGIWGNCKFYINEAVEDCDYWVVYDYIPKEEATCCPKENLIFIAGEPTSIKKYDQEFLNQFSKVITCQRSIKGPNVFYVSPGTSWFPKKSYDELSSNDQVEKSKLISLVVSNKVGTQGHKKRLDFCLKLKEHFGDKMDIFGRGINDFDNKWDVLAPYKYSIAMENSVEEDNMTEKIGDCFTTLTFPFYHGCPNIERYFDRDSYELIDINDFESSCKTIERIINDEGHYKRHLKSLVESKNRYINQYSLMPLIANFIENEYKDTNHSIVEKMVIKPPIKRGKNIILRILSRILRMTRKIHQTLIWVDD